MQRRSGIRRWFSLCKPRDVSFFKNRDSIGGNKWWFASRNLFDRIPTRIALFININHVYLLSLAGLLQARVRLAFIINWNSWRWCWCRFIIAPNSAWRRRIASISIHAPRRRGDGRSVESESDQQVYCRPPPLRRQRLSIIHHRFRMRAMRRRERNYFCN